MAAPATVIEMTLSGRALAWLAAFAGAAAWLGGEPAARLAAALLAAPLLIDLVAKQRGLHHTAVRVAPRRTVAGAAYRETLLLEHRGRRTLRECLLSEPRTMRNEPAVLLATLATGEPLRVDVRQRSTIRSHLLERVFVMVSYWPLGLFRSRCLLRVPADLVTEPQRVPLRAEVIAAAAEQEAAPFERSLLPGPEFVALREHLPDEDARSVHALRSAALGTLVRRVTRGRMPRKVGVVIDLRRAPEPRPARSPRRVEWSLGAAATLVEQLVGFGAELQVVVLGSEIEFLAVRDGGSLRELLTLLAEAGVAPARKLPDDTLERLRGLARCFWIPVGGHRDAPERPALRGDVQLVTEDA